MAVFRDAGDLLRPRVVQALSRLQLEDCDEAAVQLAILYAQHVDTAEDPAAALIRLGPRLLAVLESLGATPAGRSRVKQSGTPANGALAAFRASSPV